MQQTDLGTHLQTNVAGQFQIVQLFLKALALVSKVAGGLCILRQTGGFGLIHGLPQFVGAHIGQLFLAGKDIHAQLLEVCHVQLIHLVQHGDVLEQLHLMCFQHGLDLFHVGLGLVVLCFEGVQLVGLLLEEAHDALLLFLVGVKALQLADEVGDHIAHLAQILGGHLGEGCFGEIADLLLAGRAVLQHLLAVGDVDLLGKLIHHGLFLGAQLHLCLRGRGSGGLFLLRYSGGGGVQRQGGHCGGIQIKIQGIVSHK